MTSYLADVNVWVAIAHEAHMHHERAREWFHQLDRDQAWFCRFTQMGLLRLLTNYKVMGDRARTQSGAWEIVDQFNRNGRVQYLDEPPGVTVAFRNLTQRNRRGNSSWSDAYIGAVAQGAGLTVATFDRDFLTLGVEALILT
jgi:toxin-antitoxin system PIN domain toxin